MVLIMEEEGIWTLGNGTSIRPFHDPWVPQQPNFRIRPRVETPNNHDRGLVHWVNREERMWRDQEVRQAVQAEDVDSVLAITIPLYQQADVLRWPHSRSGDISVKSAYHCIHNKMSPIQIDLNRQLRPNLPGGGMRSGLPMFGLRSKLSFGKWRLSPYQPEVA